MPFGSKEFCGKVIARSLHVFALAVSGCKCKAQTALVTNTTPTSAHLSTVEDSKFGLTSLVPETVQLGLVVYGKVRLSTDLDLSPVQGPPDLFQRTTYSEWGGRLTLDTSPVRGGFTKVFRKACDAAAQLLLTVKLTTVSIRARAIFYGTYCLSKFTYVASYAIATPQDIYMMQARVEAVLRRHWIQAQHLPGVLRALKIAPMQDIEIAFARAAVGLLERRAREDSALRSFVRDPTLGYQGDRQLGTAAEYLTRYLPTLDPTDTRTIQGIVTNAAFH